MTSDNYIHPPSVILSTPMDNVRWVRAVNVERGSKGWAFVVASVVGAGISVPLFHLAIRPDAGPNGFFLGTGIAAGSFALLSAVFAVYTFARGDRMTSYDLVDPRP